MALAPEVLTRGLAVVRYLYDLALQQGRQAGLRRGAAILTFHDAVEMFLVLGLQHHDVYSARRLYQFGEYWTELASAGVGATQRGTMEALSRVRANFKHHTILPSPSALEDARVHVRDFFTENAPIVFGVNLEDISLASTVSFERTRAYLEEAEKHMTDSLFDEAIGKIALAFAILLVDYEASRLQGRSTRARNPSLLDRLQLSLGGLDTANRGDPSIPRRIADRLRDFGDHVRSRFDSIDTTLKLVGLGIDYERYLRFASLAPVVVMLASEDPSRWGRAEWHRDSPPTLDDCRFCFDFVIDSSLRLQEVVYQE